MRRLTVRQKQYLDSISHLYRDGQPLETEHEGKLAKLKDYETMWSDAQRYLHDKAMEYRFN